MTTGYRPEIIQSAFVDFIGSRLHPFWSLTTPKLRFIARQVISEELVALKFEANQAFKRLAFTMDDGWHGGQHIHLTVPIEGINHQRSYSLVGMFPQSADLHDAIFDNNVENDVNANANANASASASASASKYLRDTVTIAIKPQGLVSDYLTKQAPLGTVFNSSLPSGDFTLADTSAQLAEQKSEPSCSKQSPLLFIAGGSGITPMLGLITQALAQSRNVTLLYYYRTSLAKAPFQAYWQHLATAYPHFTYYIVNTADLNSYSSQLAGSRHLDVDTLSLLPLSLAESTIFACGSSSLLAGLYRALETLSLPSDSHTLTPKRSLRDNVIVERFGTALPDSDMSAGTNEETADIETQTVYLRGRQQQFSSGTTLLLGAEQAGIRLSHGCRQGICQLCRCQKISGVVKNIQTGKLSSNGFESIQTCINIPMTEVTLDV